ncbi:hypothetical protein ACRFBT_24970 [Pseudomonas aeruginosa]|uniref:hypothetical protein n=1 Tax=Pseudomonas aeruginosa TaxID=287 RepID=UPI003D6E795A
MIRWFSPPRITSARRAGPDRFYELVCRPDEPIRGMNCHWPTAPGFSRSLFYRQPVSDATREAYGSSIACRAEWSACVRLNKARADGHFTGGTLKGDGLNALFDRMPEAHAAVHPPWSVTPQGMLEGHLPSSSRKGRW